MSSYVPERAVGLPRAYLGRQPATVELFVSLTTITADEAETFAFELWKSARLARHQAGSATTLPPMDLPDP